MNEHYEEWLDYLATTDDPQAKEALFNWLPEQDDPEYPDSLGYCCLGIACKIAGPEGQKYIAEPGDYTLLPIEIADWLGLKPFWEDKSEEAEMDLSWDGLLVRDPAKNVDIYLDYPFDLNGPPGGAPVTASGLNDWGCSFAEIVDMLRYFGIKKVAA